MPQPTEKEINDYVLKLSGKVSILEPIEIGRNYKVEIDGTITNETLSDNQDGKFNLYYKFEPILAKIKKDNGEIIKAKDPRKNSQKLRNLLYAIWLNNNDSSVFEDFYDEFMTYVMLHADNLYRSMK